jgi:hypothetical protein
MPGLSGFEKLKEYEEAQEVHTWDRMVPGLN